MSHQDNSVFLDTSGRRRRAVRWAVAVVGAGCLGFLGVVVAGVFGAGPTGGPLHWQDDDRPALPKLIESQPGGGDSGGSGDSGADGSAKGAPSGSPSATATPSATQTSAPAKTAAPAPTAARTTTAPPPAPTATSNGPGKAGSAPGATKRPK
ncbi:hypothetical protein [Streptomyces sp. NPDC004788]